ncbi:NTP pyrophosphohydrolase [Pseudoclavibacter endophyticus]|uniref:NUDIX hydrolase n=1 Tax=Pseudoclavibacter endophyticus TaxID=1778590 RepID=A0A6H9WMJ6_9MICO|nr:NUDIX hydrolase [Pseudoclavibacter endophyticus]KAB1650413.1 NUDIX hydrolase [Pseudoclavibacter endophyticus]GGA54325.1 NTP pyrophosphohydrolase [Pseudoclavibacter endophyticus]
MTDGSFADEPADVEIASRETLHDGYVWNVVSERFVLGGQTITREFVDHTGAVAVLALDDDDRALFIRQYRHPVRVRDWELPAGLLDQPGEDALEAAKRELAEEADLVAEQWWVLQDFFTTPGGNNESIRVYLARGVRPTDEAFARTHEEAEIEPRWVALDDAARAVREGRIHNASTVIAIYAACASRAAGWADLRPADAPWPTRPPGPAA